jgi:hypothetical protein
MRAVPAMTRVKTHKVVCWLLSDPGLIPDIDDVERFGRDGPGAVMAMKRAPVEQDNWRDRVPR